VASLGEPPDVSGVECQLPMITSLGRPSQAPVQVPLTRCSSASFPVLRGAAVMGGGVGSYNVAPS